MLRLAISTGGGRWRRSIDHGLTTTGAGTRRRRGMVTLVTAAREWGCWGPAHGFGSARKGSEPNLAPPLPRSSPHMQRELAISVILESGHLAPVQPSKPVIWAFHGPFCLVASRTAPCAASQRRAERPVTAPAAVPPAAPASPWRAPRSSSAAFPLPPLPQGAAPPPLPAPTWSRWWTTPSCGPASTAW